MNVRGREPSGGYLAGVGIRLISPVKSENQFCYIGFKQFRFWLNIDQICC
jgi:hypothetical protein